MPIYVYLEKIRAISATGTPTELINFFRKQSSCDQDRIVLLLYVGRDHLNSSTLSDNPDWGMEAFRKTVPSENYEDILTKQFSNLKLYADAIIRCSGSAKFDLNRI